MEKLYAAAVGLGVGFLCGLALRVSRVDLPIGMQEARMLVHGLSYAEEVDQQMDYLTRRKLLGNQQRVGRDFKQRIQFDLNMSLSGTELKGLQNQLLRYLARANGRVQEATAVLPRLVALDKAYFHISRERLLCRKRAALAGDLQAAVEKRRLDFSIKQCEVEKAQKELKVLQFELRRLEEEVARERQEVLECKRHFSECARQKEQLQSSLGEVRALRQQTRAKEDNIRNELVAVAAERQSLRKRIQNFACQKRKLNNELQELKGNIRVYCRVRPFLHFDPPTQTDKEVVRVNENQLSLRVPQDQLKTESHMREYGFTFEHIFGPDTSQGEVFNELIELVQSAMDGKNVCIFAYGQTGSGKTYTMEGGEGEAQGIIPRTSRFLFEEIKKADIYGAGLRLFFSVQEVYMDSIRDLLDTSNRQEAPTELEARGQQDIRRLVLTAKSNRTVAETSCNEHSSRSHCIFTLRVRSGKDKREGVLNLIDLAGSERVGQSKVEGQRMKETNAINKSLTSLSLVITALARKDSHVPYRNSKLTYLLQPFLQGDSKTLMLVNISPLKCNFHPSLCALRFAQDVKRVRGTVSPLKK